MIIGRMNKRIQLQEKIKTPDGRGGSKSSWSPVATVWAEFRKPNLDTMEQAGAIVSRMTQKISIRYRADVRKDWQVVYGNRIFDVLHTYDYGKEATILVCQEVVV